MERLTVNKSVSEMSMVELARNSCFVKDHNATYRDFKKEVDARDFIRKIGTQFGIFEKGCAELIDDESFDETMIDYLQYGYDTKEGLIALFYRNLWAQADLYITLKYYEDLEKQGLLLKLPCAVGDTVYTNCSMQGWYFRKENRPYAAKVVFIGFNGSDNYINIDFENGHMLQFKFSDIGKTVFLTQAEAEEALKKMNETEE